MNQNINILKSLVNRLFQFARIKALLFALLSISITLLIISGNEFTKLKQTYPSSLQGSEHYFTYGVENPDGDLLKAPLSRIIQFADHHALDYFAYFGYINISVRNANSVETEFTFILIDEKFEETTGLQLPRNGLEVSLSDSFWSHPDSELNANEFDNDLVLPGNKPLAYIGEVDEKILAIFPESFDFLISVENLPLSFDLSAAYEEGSIEPVQSELLDQLIYEIPRFYAFGETPISEQNIWEELSYSPQRPSNRVNLSTGVENFNHYISDGVDFNPSTTKFRKDRFHTLLVLTILFCSMFLLTFLSHIFINFLSRKSEFNTKKILGASNGRLCLDAIIEYIPFILLANLATIFFCAALQLSGLYLFSIGSLSYFAIAIILNSCIVASCCTFPFIFYEDKPTFERISSSERPVHKIFRTSAISIQQVISGVGFAVALSFIFQQLDIIDSFPRSIALDSFTLNAQQSNVSGQSPQEWRNLFADELRSDYALISQPFVRPYLQSASAALDGDFLNSTARLNIYPVSPNFFDVAGHNVLHNGVLSGSNVIINTTSLSILEELAETELVPPFTLYFDGSNFAGLEDGVPLVVVGIVPDLPHFGVDTSARPIIYSDIFNLDESRTHLIMDVVSSDTDFFDDHSTNGFYSHVIESSGNIFMQIANMNGPAVRAVLLSLIIALILTASAVSGAYFQILNILYQESEYINLTRSFGANYWNHFVSYLYKFLPVLLISIIFIGLTLNLMSGKFFELFSVSLFRKDVVLLTILIVFLGFLCSLIFALRRVFSGPILR